jgi:hypothetical protein
MKPEYKIDKDKLREYYEITDLPEFSVEGYESPITMITNDIAKSVAETYDNNVMKAVWSIGIEVDKDGLVKALQYDREQYETGYRNGFEAAYNTLPRWARKLLRRRIGWRLKS